MNSTAVQSNKSPPRLATQSHGATHGTAQGGKQPPADGAVWRVKREGKGKHGSAPLAAEQLVEQIAQRQAQADDTHGQHDGEDEWHGSGLLARLGRLGAWQRLLAAVNRSKVVDQRLDRLDSWVASVTSRQLSRQGLGDSSGSRHRLPVGGPERAQALNEWGKDGCAHGRIVFPFAGSCQPISGKSIARTSHKGSSNDGSVAT